MRIKNYTVDRSFLNLLRREDFKILFSDKYIWAKAKSVVLLSLFLFVLLLPQGLLSQTTYALKQDGSWNFIAEREFSSEELYYSDTEALSVNYKDCDTINSFLE